MGDPVISSSFDGGGGGVVSSVANDLAAKDRGNGNNVKDDNGLDLEDATADDDNNLGCVALSVTVRHR